MKANACILLLTAILISLCSCVTLYKPNAVHSPLLQEKGEAHASASLGLSGSGLLNLQASYALSDHVGIVADGMYHYRNSNSGDSTNNTTEKLRMLFVETGAGYFTSFWNNGLFQCYGGGGYGNSNDRITNVNGSYPELNAKYYNLFIQPGLAYTSKNFDLAFDIRANYVHMFSIHAYLYEQFDWWNTEQFFYSDTSISFMNLEPAVTIKVGAGKLKSMLQLGLIFPFIKPEAYFMVNTSSMLLFPLAKISLGFTYTFRKKQSAGKKGLAPHVNEEY